MKVASRLLILLLPALLAACGGPAIQGVADVEILGGDRAVGQGATALLTATVSAGGGVATTVTWSSSDESVATVDAAGMLTAHRLGTTTLTATSTADAGKSDSIAVTVVVPEGTFRAILEMDLPVPILGAALVMMDTSGGIGPSSVTEIMDGTFLGQVSPIDEDGGFNIQLPRESEIPATLFRSATNMVSLLTLLPDCQLQASTTGARVTEAMAQRLPSYTAPAVALLGSFGGGVTLAVGNPIDPTWSDEELLSQEFGTWVYATEDVSLTSIGTDCQDPSSLTSYSVDVDLEAGWNHLAWHYEFDATTSEFLSYDLRNTATTEWHLFVLP